MQPCACANPSSCKWARTSKRSRVAYSACSEDCGRGRNRLKPRVSVAVRTKADFQKSETLLNPAPADRDPAVALDLELRGIVATATFRSDDAADVNKR
jgi:hypothetical protein